MLFILTGDVRIGKSRWLCGLADDLENAGLPVCGVIAPGRWRESSGTEADGNGFEKLGIDNLLLPQRELIPFGVRADLADGSSLSQATQSSGAGLGWCISDEAIARVNRHFASLPERVAQQGGSALLVVDELGRLELRGGGGLTGALALLEAGPSEAIPHALVVVRGCLADEAQARLAPIWGGALRIAPDDEGRAIVSDRLRIAI